MGAWQQRKLGELIRVKHGYAFSGQYFGSQGPYVVLTPGNFCEEGGFKSRGDKEKRYSGKFPKQYLLRQGDLLVAMTEQGEGLLGSSALVPANDQYLHNQRLGRVEIVDEQACDQKFLYYLFNTGTVRRQIRATATGTKIRHTSPSGIGEVIAAFPPLDEQRRIAGILSAYDDLIENCQSRGRVLEELVRRLYLEWFVQFRYPGHERLADPSHGFLPAGWKWVTLGSLTTKIGSGGTPRGGKAAYQHTGTALIRSMNVYDYRFEYSHLAYINERQARSLKSVSVQAGDILLNITGTSVARCALAPAHQLPARVNQHVALIRADAAVANSSFLVDTLNNERYRSKLLALAQGGATREALTKETLSGFPILLPPPDLLERYHRIAGPIHLKREALQQQIQCLRTSRDLLLPRLLSGEWSG